MEFNEYQELARKTAVYPETGDNFTYPTLGLVSEAGEIADKIKKLSRDKGIHRPSELSDEERLELQKEIGDVLWYLSCLAAELKLTLDDVAVANLEKTQSRQKRGQLSGSGDNR